METQKTHPRRRPTPSRSKLVADGVECKNPELGKSIAAGAVEGWKNTGARRGIDSIGSRGIVSYRLVDFLWYIYIYIYVLFIERYISPMDGY